jgi:TRAP-type C4-dicarboxylate transport system substrate-binding protein
MLRPTKTATLVLAAAGLCFATAATAQTIELKASHFLPPNHTFQKALIAWGEELAAASNGRLKLTIYPAAQLGRRRGSSTSRAPVWSTSRSACTA